MVSEIGSVEDSVHGDERPGIGWKYVWPVELIIRCVSDVLDLAAQLVAHPNVSKRTWSRRYPQLEYPGTTSRRPRLEPAQWPRASSISLSYLFRRVSFSFLFRLGVLVRSFSFHLQSGGCRYAIHSRFIGKGSRRSSRSRSTGYRSSAQNHAPIHSVERAAGFRPEQRALDSVVMTVLIRFPLPVSSCLPTECRR